MLRKTLPLRASLRDGPLQIRVRFIGQREMASWINVVSRNRYYEVIELCNSSVFANVAFRS